MAQSKKEIEYAPFKDGGDHPFPVEDILLPYSECYNVNILVKKAFAKTDLTQEHISEIIKCSDDPLYFIENYCRIISLDSGIVPFKVYDFQREMINSFQENRFTLNLLARQNGKCVALNTCMSFRNKHTGVIYDNIPIGLFYEWRRFREVFRAYT